MIRRSVWLARTLGAYCPARFADRVCIGPRKCRI